MFLQHHVHKECPNSYLKQYVQKRAFRSNAGKYPGMVTNPPPEDEGVKGTRWHMKYSTRGWGIQSIALKISIEVEVILGFKI